MQISSISSNQNAYLKRNLNQNSAGLMPKVKSYDADSVSFQGNIKPEVLKNQLKIFLTQDIWAVNLKVKKPETPLEKEVLLEVLQNRSKLDRFTRLSNERFALKGKVINATDWMKNNPSHPNLPKLMDEIEKKGNLEKVFKTFDKNIDYEKKKHKDAYDYFKNIEKLEEQYLENRDIKLSWMEKFWQKVNKNNLNTDGKYSTKELIDIISKGEATPVAKVSKGLVQPLSKKQLLAQIEKQYEQALRESVDIYDGRFNHGDDALKARKIVEECNANSIKKFAGTEKQFPRIYGMVEKRFLHKIDRIQDTDVYPLGELWKQMDEIELAIKAGIKELAEKKEILAKEPQNIKLKELLAQGESIVNEYKKDWILGAKSSLNYEKQNRGYMEKAGKLSEYDYLTSENKILNRHKKAIEILENNNSTIPDKYWPELLG